MELTNNDIKSQNFTLTTFPTSQTFSCRKIRFKTEVCSCPNFPTEAMLWIKEVKEVNSVYDLKLRVPFRDLLLFPDFEFLDARIASALNKISQNSYFKKKVSLEEQKTQKAGRFLRGRLIAYLIYDYFRVTDVNESVLDYADFFRNVVRNHQIQEFDTRWDEILLSMEQVPPDDVLTSLYKSRRR